MPQEDTFECPLVELGLIQELERGLYRFVRGPKRSLHDSVLLYALLDYWERTAPQQSTLSFEAILGFAAISIALLARGNLFAVIPVAAYFAALEVGTSGMGRVLAVPGGIVFVIQALPLIMVAAIIGINGMRRKAAL